MLEVQGPWGDESLHHEGTSKGSHQVISLILVGTRLSGKSTGVIGGLQFTRKGGKASVLKDFELLVPRRWTFVAPLSLIAGN